MDHFPVKHVRKRYDALGVATIDELRNPSVGHAFASLSFCADRMKGSTRRRVRDDNPLLRWHASCNNPVTTHGRAVRRSPDAEEPET
jgi:hypothetical protein